ncbi:UNVERIFIED_CONTAM: antiterminator Q family protein [Kocuria sp. CPCC 205274]
MGIENDLRRWAQWVRECGTLGIKPLAMFDDGTRESVRYMPMSDDEGLRFEPAIIALKQIDKEQYNVVRLHYIYGMSIRAVCKVVARDYKTVYAWLQEAKAFVAGFVAGQNNELMRLSCLLDGIK